MQAIRKGLAETEDIKVGAANENVNYYRRFTNKGMFKIKLTTNCTGSIIGTYEINYYPDKKLPDNYDIHFGFICVYDSPEHIVKDILNHTDPTGVDDFYSLTPVCPHCGSTLIDENTPHTDKEGNYITCEFVCCECKCEFDSPTQTM